VLRQAQHDRRKSLWDERRNLISYFGNYNLMWYADITLAALAALLNLPIREAPVLRVPPIATR
jgi:hypothetical protein